MTTFEEAQAAFLKSKKAYNKAFAKINEAQKIRDELCPHTELEEKTYYFSGNYYDTSYTEYWNVCKCCGAKSEVTRESHGHYG